VLKVVYCKECLDREHPMLCPSFELLYYSRELYKKPDAPLCHHVSTLLAVSAYIIIQCVHKNGPKHNGAVDEYQ